MSDGLFVHPILNGDRITGWTRGDCIIVGAAHFRELGTDLRFLRYQNGEVVPISQAEQDAIRAQDELDKAQAIADAAAAAEMAAIATAATDAAAALIFAEREAAVSVVREQYRAITRTICQLAGVAVVDKFPTVGAVADVVMQYGMGENALQLTQYALFLKATLDELRRMDGDDAWERI